MIECISALSVLGVIVVALLIMTRAISLEDAGALLVRGFVALVLVLWALCAMSRLLAIVLPMFKAVVIWIAAIALAILVLAFVAKLLLRLGRRSKFNNGDEQ